MFTVRVGPTPLVVLCGFRAVKEALVSHSEPLPGWPSPHSSGTLLEKEARLPSLLGTGWLGGDYTQGSSGVTQNC